jgi:hypothetical protein
VAVCEECGAAIVASTPAILRVKMGLHRLFHGHRHIRPIVVAILSISFINEAWIGRQFSYAVGLEA